MLRRQTRMKDNLNATNKVKVFDLRSFLVWSVLIALVVVMLIAISAKQPSFMTARNLKNVLIQTSASALMTFGVVCSLITAGFDLSLPSIMSLSSVVGAMFIQATGNVPLGLLVIIMVGCLCGLFNGISIAYFKMYSFIVTLSTMLIADGVGTVISNSTTIPVPASFSAIAQNSLLGIPIPVVILFAVSILMHLMLSHTKLGRSIYAIGINAPASEVNGIAVNKIQVFVYTLSGALAGLAGIIITARMGSVSLSATSGTTSLDVMCAAIIGGTSVYGGKGSIVGGLMGAVFVALMQNVMNVFGISFYVTLMIRCVVILAVIYMQRLTSVEKGV